MPHGWEATDRSHPSRPSSTTAPRLTSGTGTGAKSQGRSTTHALHISLKWSGCCWPQTCVSAFICGRQLKDKGVIFKSRNENQGPRSHWLVMKAGGRRPRCASQTSLLCPQLSRGAEGGDVAVVPPAPLRHQKSSRAALGDLSLQWNCFTGASSENLLLWCVVQGIPPGYRGERQLRFSEAVLLFQHTGEVTSGDLQKTLHRSPPSSLGNAFEIHLPAPLLTARVI